MAVISGMAGCSSKDKKALNNLETNPVQTESSNLEKADVINAAVSPVYPKSIAFGDYDGWFSVRKDNKLEDSFSNSLKEFSIKSTSEVLKNSVNVFPPFK